jgi:hypothetical protein
LDYGLDISGSKRFPVLDYFEEGFNPSCSIKYGKFFDHIEDYDLNYAAIRAA